ncbi:uncharacterized protein LOC111713721 [Eurytemora carolleeae]|uniref:uncharacterized protein LOC111713721 n=1 Tax=Eurytemora carolleeae TaxID=1294199 RepID=UPI000C757A57|nr:uncharacterized protein LOC111713721 [Eurytemora carolleeae]|eukprot:XP_023344427.1 uncharacterized protein LOC111713721 [Eurytemora affinis]
MPWNRIIDSQSSLILFLSLEYTGREEDIYDYGRQSSCSEFSLSSLGRNSSLPPHGDRREGKRSISVPPGLKAILNLLSKQVLNERPNDVSGLCADLLERGLEERGIEEHGAKSYYLDKRWIAEHGLSSEDELGAGRSSRSRRKVGAGTQTETAPPRSRSWREAENAFALIISGRAEEAEDHLTRNIESQTTLDSGDSGIDCSVSLSNTNNKRIARIERGTTMDGSETEETNSKSKINQEEERFQTIHQNSILQECLRNQFSSIPPTSDFEEDWSQHETDEEKQIIDLVVNIGGRELEKGSVGTCRRVFL